MVYKNNYSQSDWIEYIIWYSHASIRKNVNWKKILVHENAGLLKALIKEKKRRKKNKNMGLFLKNKSNQIMFFFPDKINTAQSQQQFLDAQKKQKKLEKKFKVKVKVEKKTKSSKNSKM